MISESITVYVESNGTLVISNKLFNLILKTARTKGVRGSGSKSNRIQKKIVKKVLKIAITDFIKEYGNE